METNEQRPINDFPSVMEAVLKAIREKDFEQAAILASLAYNWRQTYPNKPVLLVI